MPLEDVILPGEDGRYLVMACSVFVCSLRCLPSKSQPKSKQGGGGEAKGAVEGTDEQPVRSHQRHGGELQDWGETKRHQRKDAGLQGWEIPCQEDIYLFF